jgi:hypothetical protein
MSAARRDIPFGGEFSAAIAQMKALVVQSADHELLGDGPPHPDAKLLDLCADIGHQRKVAEAALERRRQGPWAPWMCKTPAEAAASAEAKTDTDAADKRYTHLLRAAAKLKAATPAGGTVNLSSMEEREARRVEPQPSTDLITQPSPHR